MYLLFSFCTSVLTLGASYFSAIAVKGAPVTQDREDTVPKLRWALSIPKPKRYTDEAVFLERYDTIPEFSYTKIAQTKNSLQKVAADAVAQLLTYQNPDTLTFNNISWWQSANAYTAIIQFDILRDHMSRIETNLLDLIPLGDPNQANSVGLRNTYNDDTLWWVQACLDAHQVNGDSRYQDEALRQLEWIKDTSQITQAGIAPNMGGIQRTMVLSDQCELEDSVYWTTKASETVINSITTGLFMQASARMYELGQNGVWLDSSLGALDWLQKHTIGGKLELITDAVQGDTCRVSAETFSYNTGVYIGGLLALYQATGQKPYLREAEAVASSAMETTEWTDGEGMITESKDATTNNDGVGFRTVLLRNLIKLYTMTLSEDIKTEIRGFVNVNYNSLYNKARKANNYDVNWFGPFTNPTSFGQFVGVELLVYGWFVNKG